MNIVTLRRSLRAVALLAGFIATIGLLPSSAFAQGNLAKLPGLTELQAPVAAAVNQACVQFAPAGYVANPNGTPEERLFYTCRVMVQTANQLAGASGPVIANSLGISNEDLRKGVQAIAPVQMNAQKQIGNEAAKINLVGARLLDLRSGARGFVVGDSGTTPSSVASARASTLDGATGGGASTDTLGGRLGGFLNFSYNWGSVDQTDLADAYDYRNYALLAGLDYRVSDALVLGGAVSYSDTRSTYDNSLGKVDATTWGIAAYGTYYVGEWYTDAFLAYGGVDYDSVRNISIPSNSATIPAIGTSATASPKGDQWSASLGVGRSFERAPYTFTPSARLSYIWVKNKAFSEDEPVNGVGLAVEERTIKSLQSSLGAKVSTTVSTAAGVFVPYLNVQWLHEFENDSPSIISKYVHDPFNTIFAIPTASPTRDYAVLGLGSSAVFQNDWSGFAQFNAALGLNDATNYGLVIGLRKQF